MKATEIICNGIRLWKISYQGIPGKSFIVTEEKLLSLYNL